METTLDAQPSLIETTPTTETATLPPAPAKKAKEPKDRPRPPPVQDYQRELVKLINSLAHRHSHWQVFSDFCEMAAISISNAVDRPQYEKREERYMQIVKGYKKEEAQRLAEGFGMLVMALEDEFTDVLGRTFHDLELHNKWAGQFFTPYSICQMMAMMTVGDEDALKEKIKERGFITASEPACGSGAMVIALAEAMKEAKINYQQHLHVTAVDVDLKCVCMSYLQFSLLNIPAVIVHGNTLTLDEWSHWHTPAHIMGGWRYRLRREATGLHAIHAPPEEDNQLPDVKEMVAAEPVPVEPKKEEPMLQKGQLSLF